MFDLKLRDVTTEPIPLPTEGRALVYMGLDGKWRSKLADGTIVVVTGEPGAPGAQGAAGAPGAQGAAGAAGGATGATQLDFRWLYLGALEDPIDTAGTFGSIGSQLQFHRTDKSAVLRSVFLNQFSPVAGVTNGRVRFQRADGVVSIYAAPTSVSGSGIDVVVFSGVARVSGAALVPNNEYAVSFQ